MKTQILLTSTCLSLLLPSAGPCQEPAARLMNEPPPFAYKAGGRRDPFLTPSSAEGAGRANCSLPGLPGLLIQEVALRGIVRAPAGPIAFLVGPNGRAHFARPRDVLCDGRVEAIHPGRVVFRQDVLSPLTVEKTRPVELLLRPEGTEASPVDR